MNYSEILPAHWKVVEEDDLEFSFFSDDGRDLPLMDWDRIVQFHSLIEKY